MQIDVDTLDFGGAEVVHVDGSKAIIKALKGDVPNGKALVKAIEDYTSEAHEDDALSYLKRVAIAALSRKGIY